MKVRLRDGSTTTSPSPAAVNSVEGLAAIQAAIAANDNDGNQKIRGRHESEAFYYECDARDRNPRLYTADQRVRGTSARYTRQNRNGNRRGLECPEERDYYPYWSPTPWRDIAYMGSDMTRCAALTAQSQNVVKKYKCVDGTDKYTRIRYHPIDAVDCVSGQRRDKNGQTRVVQGVWKGFTHSLPQPLCLKAPWTRDNHLGNARGVASGMGTPSFNWTLPSFAALKASGVKTYNGDTVMRCVVRLRYNITTDDYDAWNTTSTQNTLTKRVGEVSRVSPVTQDPIVDVGIAYRDSTNEEDPAGLRLNIDTSQFGRVFQDRSHVFLIKKKAAALPAHSRVLNLNVRGKRGNIVQTYPATEYDFVPTRFHISTSDLLHIQWTGSNTHNNGGGGGDGQAGDAGEGTSGTDRQNFVQLRSLLENYPLPLDKNPNIYDDMNCFDINGNPIPTRDCQIRLTTSGHFLSEAALRAGNPTDTAAKVFDPLLNESPASLANGILVQFKKKNAAYAYMSSRNNNFSNRSQKGQIVVDP